VTSLSLGGLRCVKDLNTCLRGWSNYFDYGYPRKAFRDVCH
jgi:RNA-directed DNA polymerase